MTRRSRLVRELARYGQSHQTRANVAVHIVCVPLLIWSAACILAVHHQRAAWVALSLASLRWLSLTPLVGGLATVLYTCLIANAFQAGVQWREAIYLHLFSWALQLLSHTFLEKKRPAFLDGLLQAFSSAPLFVVFDVLFLVGFDPALRRDVEALAASKVPG